MPRKQVGIIQIPPHVFIDVHEKRTADFLALHLGYDIKFLAPSRIVGTKTPDMKMDNKLWEIKSPLGKSPRTIENNLRNALTQSANIVLDLRRMDRRIPEAKLLRESERQFHLAKSMKRLIIITRQESYVLSEKAFVKKKAG